MTELSIAEQDFLAKKAELQIVRQDEAKKREDIATLDRRQQDLNTELAALKNRLAQSGQAMANGEMTSDDYIALKRSISDKELESEAVGEALEAQNDALQLLMDNSQILNRQLSRQLPVVAGEVKQRALVAGVAGRDQHLKVFAFAVAAQYLERSPFSGQGKTEQVQLAYRIIGEELCKAVFADDSEVWQLLVEPGRAKDMIEEIVGKAA